jgi:hypothetical protein
VTSMGRALGYIVWPAWVGTVLCSCAAFAELRAFSQVSYSTYAGLGRNDAPFGDLTEMRCENSV